MRSLFILFLFLNFTYMGNTQKQAQYTNPILSGFYPDPSICRVGNDYYIINSSFAYYPGLPVFHSKDLVSWQQIGHAMDRPKQLDLIGAGVSDGLYAPTITYHKGVFYIVCTLIRKGGNFVITATNPAGPWSNPVWLNEVDGIDPSLFFDTDDKAYIIYNSTPPDNQSLWDGHRTIRMRSFDYKNLKVAAEEKLIVNGGTDIAKKPVWIEGPHIYKVNDWYYLLCAEGGTGYNHSEVVFRSKSVDGPFIPFEGNPILTQRHLDPNRKNPITTTGHADFIETPEGKWYAVFLGCRPYEGNHYNTGRETFLTPVAWKNGWPVITEGLQEVQYTYPAPYPQASAKATNPYSGNFTYRNQFNTTALDHRFTFLRTVTKPWYSLTQKKGALTLQLQPETVSGKDNPSMVAFRQSHLKADVSTALTFQPAAENEKAGLIAFQSENSFYYLYQTIQEGQPVIQLEKATADGKGEVLASDKLPAKANELFLKIEARGNHYNFLYALDNKTWKTVKANIDAKFLSTESARGFVGVVFGMYATSSEKPSQSKAHFNAFYYQGLDDVYKQ